MKILLFGKSGQVGWELQRSLAPLGEVVALDRQGHGELSGDFCRVETLEGTIRQVAPEVIVNAAGYTAVDKAEGEPETARLVNAVAPRVLAQGARDTNALLVHYSTDYVFDGSGSRPWTETSDTRPLNTYGLTKLEGERAIARSGCRYLIFRTSWVFGARGQNFIKTILRLARDRAALSVVNDQVGAPTGADLIADVTAHCVRAAARTPSLEGTYHLAASGSTNWHEYACHVVTTAHAQGRRVMLQSSAIQPIPTSQYPTPARRPANSRLDCGKIEAAFGLRMPRWTDGVDRCMAELPLD